MAARGRANRGCLDTHDISQAVRVGALSAGDIDAARLSPGAFGTSQGLAHHYTITLHARNGQMSPSGPGCVKSHLRHAGMSAPCRQSEANPTRFCTSEPGLTEPDTLQRWRARDFRRAACYCWPQKHKGLTFDDRHLRKSRWLRQMTFPVSFRFKSPICTKTAGAFPLARAQNGSSAPCSKCP